VAQIGGVERRQCNGELRKTRHSHFTKGAPYALRQPLVWTPPPHGTEHRQGRAGKAAPLHIPNRTTEQMVPLLWPGGWCASHAEVEHGSPGQRMSWALPVDAYLGVTCGRPRVVYPDRSEGAPLHLLRRCIAGGQAGFYVRESKSSVISPV
jgi:hypothetical protein